MASNTSRPASNYVEFMPVDTCPNFGKVHHYEFRGAYSNLNVDDLLIQTCECGAIKATPLKELANASKA